MPDPRWVSDCCGAKHSTTGQPTRYAEQNAGRIVYYLCVSCGQPCDSMRADVRSRIVREGMERAAKVCEFVSGQPIKFADAISRNACASAIRAAMEEL